MAARALSGAVPSTAPRALPCPWGNVCTASLHRPCCSPRSGEPPIPASCTQRCVRADGSTAAAHPTARACETPASSTGNVHALVAPELRACQPQRLQGECECARRACVSTVSVQLCKACFCRQSERAVVQGVLVPARRACRAPPSSAATPVPPAALPTCSPSPVSSSPAGGAACRKARARGGGCGPEAARGGVEERARRPWRSLKAPPPAALPVPRDGSAARGRHEKVGAVPGHPSGGPPSGPGCLISPVVVGETMGSQGFGGVGGLRAPGDGKSWGGGQVGVARELLSLKVGRTWGRGAGGAWPGLGALTGWGGGW